MPKINTDVLSDILAPVARTFHPVVVLAGMTAVVYACSTIKYYGGCIFIVFICAHTVYAVRRQKSFKYSVFSGPMSLLIWATANLLWQTRTNWPEHRKIWMWACIWLAFSVCLEAYGEKVRTWTTLRVTSSNIKEATEDMLFTLGDLFVDYFRNATVLVTLVYSAYLFVAVAGLPWGMPWIFFLPPIAYVSYRFINSKTRPRFGYVLFVLANITMIAFYPVKEDYIAEIPKCHGINIGVCEQDYHNGPPVNGQPGCCCLQTTSPWPGVDNFCTPCAIQAAKGTDCLGRPVPLAMVPHVASGGNLCNNDNSKLFMKDIYEEDFGCLCSTTRHKDSCGKTCEIYNYNYCKRVTYSREEQICSNIPPGTDSPLICNQMGAGT